LRHRPVRPYTLALLLIAALFSRNATAQRVIAHDLQVHIDPALGRMEVRDVVTLPPGATNNDSVAFILNSALMPQSRNRLEKAGRLGAFGDQQAWRIYPGKAGRSFTLNYTGTIQSGVQTRNEAIGKTQQSSRGHIGEDGVFLDGASAWYPYLPDTLQTFRLRITLPEGWQAVSQGQGPDTIDHAQQWVEETPQDDIYLIAAPFTLYRQATPYGEAQAFLRRPDPALAQRYLGVTADYLSLYSRLIGPYPYAKFAVVENFWESGYGMPSFTLLGPRVLRLPFILRSSYPHEILHNWWGNSVYIDYARGNWSEGLTTYLADHLFKEMEGHGAEYRRDALKRYTEFTRAENDFPVIQFTARHGEASQAVGYDKVLMIFHMLRRELGDEAFITGLQNFYRDFRFKAAGFADICHMFEGTAHRGLCDSYKQWLQRPGAPAIQLGQVESRKSQSGYQLRFTLAQTQDEGLFNVPVPVAIQLEGRDKALFKTVTLADREQRFSLDLPGKPQRIAIDPEYDILRRLDPAELPPTLARLFAAERLNLILPAEAGKAIRNAYAQLASAWAEGQPQVRILWDNEIKALPQEGAVWVLGWSNRFSQSVIKRLPKGQATITKDRADIAGETVDVPSHSLVLTTQGEKSQALALLVAHDEQAIPGLARKVPHYGKYSYLTFSGNAPDNVHKGQWQILWSPLQRELVPSAPKLMLPQRPRLTAALD